MACYWYPWNLYHNINEIVLNLFITSVNLKKGAGAVNFGRGMQKDLAVVGMKPKLPVPQFSAFVSELQQELCTGCRTPPVCTTFEEQGQLNVYQVVLPESKPLATSNTSAS